ncbi:hypothetical protein HYH03_015361 [Edaphochlamys debaryana]|uniref:EF-hand domain-containing protein n=1 Tax=Edaphochlamys debaryana TaxID=47281 RepID=A0A835XM99_9CHLO|nr:hypothetical protein HYH03_015361 [Edaphochlamys debaryana]|eukprot:KAG2485917.1 hypothetical protein HYH03_015361 [Edaphochlamys debaryana]
MGKHWEANGVFCSACHTPLPGNWGNAIQCVAQPAPGCVDGSRVYAFFTRFKCKESGPFFKVAFSDALYSCTDGSCTLRPSDGWLDYLRRAGPAPGHKKDTKEHAEYFCPPCWAGVSTQEEREAVNAACDGRVACFDPAQYARNTQDAGTFARFHSPYAHQGPQKGHALRWESAGAACAGCARELPKNAGSWVFGEGETVCFYSQLSEAQSLHTAGFQPAGWVAPVEPRKMFRVLEYVRRLKDDTPPCKYYCVPCWAAEAGEEERAGTTRACRSHGIGVLTRVGYQQEGAGADGPGCGPDEGAPAAPALLLLTTGAGCLARGAPAALRFFDTSGDGVLSLAEIRAGVQRLEGHTGPNALYTRALLQFLEALHVRYRANPGRMQKQLKSAVGKLDKQVVKELIAVHACERDPLLVWGIVAWYTSKRHHKIAAAVAQGEVELPDGERVALVHPAGGEALGAEARGLVADLEGSSGSRSPLHSASLLLESAMESFRW